ncbi:MAG: hypothetical protein WAO42_12385 [Caldicoprobacterales bacterium]
MYSVELADGTEIKNLELNGNNFIPDTIIDETVFENNLDKVTIIDEDGNVEELKNAKVIFTKVLDKQSFILIEKTKEEIEKETLYQLLADLTETVLLGGAK